MAKGEEVTLLHFRYSQIAQDCQMAQGIAPLSPTSVEGGENRGGEALRLSPSPKGEGFGVRFPDV